MATKKATKTSKKKTNKSAKKATKKVEAKKVEKKEEKKPVVQAEQKMDTMEVTVANKPTKIKAQRNENIFSRIFSNLAGEGKELSKYDKRVQQVEEFEKTIKPLSDEELRAKTFEFRERLKGVEDKDLLQKKLDEILPEAFAVVREAAVRTIGQRHYPVQLVGGMVLHEGRIAEMRTGEGKTLVSTLSAYLNALPEKNQVHMVTVNDYLARRDASWMGEIFDFLGLTVGVIQNQASFYFKLGAESDAQADKKRELGQVETFEDGVQQDARAVLDVENLVPCSRMRAYSDDETGEVVDIVYGVNSEFGFDYLRDNMATIPKEIVQKAGHKVAIVDEVDSILIDEARTPLIISAQAEDAAETYKLFASISRKLKKDLHYEVDEKRKNVTMTDLGIEKVQDLLGVPDLYESEKMVTAVHKLEQAMKAEALFNKDKEYVVRDGEVVIVDENTGRMMFGRRYNQGLHQAIEAKENLQIKAESKTTATITFQNYFRMYDKLSGMTGTAATESEEFFKIYELLVVTIPTNRQIARIDETDLVFKTEKGKFKAIIKEVKEANEKGQPVLIGTTSIEKNLMLSQYLSGAGIKHNLLNAKNHEQEARIISEAGRKGCCDCGYQHCRSWY